MRGVLIFCALILASCTQAPRDIASSHSEPPRCEGEPTGDWIGTAPESVSFRGDCSFRYSGRSGCVNQGKYFYPTQVPGAAALSVEHTRKGACLPAGQYRCTYSVAGAELTLNCGLGAFKYERAATTLASPGIFPVQE